jgi:preprotein translocase subunit SecG
MTLTTFFLVSLALFLFLAVALIGVVLMSMGQGDE